MRKSKNHYEEITAHGEIGLMPKELFIGGEDLREKFEKQKRLELRALGRAAAEN